MRITRGGLLKSSDAAGAYQPQSGVGLPAVLSGAVGVTVTTYYGLRADGTYYYDPAGPSAGDEAVLTVDPASPSGFSFVKVGA